MTDAPRLLRVFINGRGVDIPAGSTVIDAVRAAEPNEAEAVLRGERLITDSRGLSTLPDGPVQAGSIFRLISARRASPAADSGDSADHEP